MSSKINSVLYKLLHLFLLILFCTNVFAQKIVTGSITNKTDNKPIAGATVQIKGTTIGTQTNADGDFTIKVPQENSVLSVTVVGYQTTETSVAGKSNINFSLSQTTSLLNEVVVTGYSAQKKKDITGSVAVVNVTNMKSVPAGSVESALQGQASGVTIINSGMPGGGSNVRIRGITSLGSVDPLVIIDGVQGDMHDLNVNDIESIQVLKDAGAASIYGVRGSNGVIVITTKKGKQGRAKIEYEGYYGIQEPLKNGFNLANPQETANAIWQQQINSGVTPSSVQYGNGPVPILPDYITPPGAKEGDPNTDPSTYNINTNQITRANKSGTDWFHEIFKPAATQSHSISVSGGSDKSTYLFSLGYFNQQGTLIQTYLKRYSIRANNQFNIKNFIRIGENMYGYYKQNPQISNQDENNAISMSYRENPIIPIYDIMRNFAGTKSQGLGNAENPYADQYRTKDDKDYDWEIEGNVYAEVDLLKHFTARTSFGGTLENFYYYSFNYTAYENAEENTNPNSFVEGSGFNSSWTWTNTIKYSNIFGNHSVTFVGGSEAISNYGRGMSASRANYFSTNPNYWALNTGSPIGQTNTGAPYKDALFSLFGRLDYGFNDKYLVSVTVRRDGSSALAPQNRFGIFPSFTGAWRISKENFMKDISWINDLKIRGGWGKLGSLSDVNPTNAYSLYSSSSGLSYYDLNGTSNMPLFGFYQSQFGNPNLKWEQDITTNIGFDATVLKEKFDISIDWYKKVISGLLFQPSLLNTAGGSAAPFVNLGNIQNTGVDASITYHQNINKDFDFDLTGTFTTYKSLVVSLPTLYVDYESLGSNRIGAFVRNQIGEPVGAFFGYEVIGLFQSADDVAKSPKQRGAAPGLFKYADINNDGKINDKDRTFFGNPNPKFTYGLDISMSYKNFDLSMFLYGSQGNDVINYIKYWTDFPQVFEGAISKDAVYNSWTPTNTNATVPMLTTAANFSNTTVFNSFYKEDGSYLRCKSLELGYSLSAGALKRIGFYKLRFYVQAANLFTITKYSGLDPELQASDLGDNSNFGIDFGNYPANQKNYNVGINLNF
ncbi:MAG: SusC/RagA family TonB-linked outer membrane protein [Chitinophagaceae bacterium]